jgi:hypothetical protein
MFLTENAFEHIKLICFKCICYLLYNLNFFHFLELDS